MSREFFIANNNFTKYLSENQWKAHLNLSDYAWTIIYDDLDVFMDSNSKTALSDLLNRIILNYHQESPANLTFKLHEKETEYIKFYGGLPPNPDKWRKKITDILFAEQRKFPKGVNIKGKKFTVNDKLSDELNEYDDNSYEIKQYGELRSYLKAVVENYCREPFTKREQIVYKDIYQELSSALDAGNLLTLTTTSNQKYEFHPHSIIEDPLSSFTYIVGASRKLNEQEYNAVSFRLSRIKKVSQRKYSPYEEKVFYKEDIDKLISERGVQFMAGDCIQAKVQFTEEGLNKFSRFIALRPRPLPSTEGDKEKRVMTFTATPLQLEAYFFKFGSDAIILEPLELRERFLNNYQKAVNSYAQK